MSNGSYYHETLKTMGPRDVSLPMKAPFPARAALLGVMGALLGSILWLLIAIAGNLERAIPAILVGVFGGVATRIEPRRGRPAQVVTLVATLIGLTVVQYFVVRYSIITERAGLGIDRSAPVLLAPAAMWSVTFGWLRVFPVDVVFWVVSAALAYWLPGRPSEAHLQPPDRRPTRPRGSSGNSASLP